MLTTNAIDRMEAAIKDRPGRVSQCIFVGAPGKKIRKNYIQFFLNAHDASKLDIDELVAMTQGATQAFLKEWIHRSVQIGSERMSVPEDKLALEQSDFSSALQEMTEDMGESSRHIIGFRVNN